MFSNRTVRLAAVLLVACAMLVVGTVSARPPQAAGYNDLVRVTGHGGGGGNTLDDEWSQLRYVKTTDYGATWSSVQTAGDVGSMAHRGTPDGQQLGDFQTVVTNDNNICYVLYAGGTAPGIYSFTGPTFAPVLVMAEGSNDMHSQGGTNPYGWCSVGKTPNGDLWAVIWGFATGGVNTFWGVKSTNNGASWGTPFVVATSPQIDATANFPHVSQLNSANMVFVLYQTGAGAPFTEKVARINTSNNSVTHTTVGQSGNQFSFYVGAVEPIGYDPTANALYCTFRNAADTGPGIFYSSDEGASFSGTSITYQVRYPSVSLRMADQTPFIVSNPGTGLPDPLHWAYFTFDELGYGGGSWVTPPETLALAPSAYDGSRPLLYVNQMYWWDATRGVGMNNIWGSVTPEGVHAERTTDGGAHWIDTLTFWDSRVDSVSASTATMGQLAGGTNGVAYVTFSFRYAPVDTSGPDISDVTLLTPIGSHGPFVISAVVGDPSGVGASTINWHFRPANNDTLIVQDQDSIVGNTYYYHIPDAAANGHQWATGDTIWFYIDATDNNNNYTAHWEQAIVVGVGFLGVNDRPVVDVESFQLLPNYPNPFNPTTQIAFDLPANYRVTLKVYNELGQQVATLVNDQLYAQGRHAIAFDGSSFASGIYFYTIKAGPYFASHKMVLLK